MVLSNAAKARTRDTQGRMQKGHFGRRRLEILSKDIGTTTRRALSSTRNAIDINLAHATPIIPKLYSPQPSIVPPTPPLNGPATDTYASRKQVARTSRVIKALDHTERELTLSHAGLTRSQLLHTALSATDNVHYLLKLDLIGLSPFQSSESRALPSTEQHTRTDHIPGPSSVKVPCFLLPSKNTYLILRTISQSISIPELEGIFVQIQLTGHAWKYRRVLLRIDTTEPDDAPVEHISDEVLLEYEEAIGNKLDENDDGSNDAEYWSSAETSEDCPPSLDIVPRAESLPPPIAIGARSESPVATIRSTALGRSSFDLVDAYSLDPEPRLDHLSLVSPDSSERAASEHDVEPDLVGAYSVSPPSPRLQSLSAKRIGSISPSDPVQQLLDSDNVHSILFSPPYTSSWNSPSNSSALRSALADIPTYDTSSVLHNQSFGSATEVILLGSILDSPDPWNLLGQILNLSPLPRFSSDPYILLNLNRTKHGVGWNPHEVDICAGDGTSHVSPRSGGSGTGGAASIPLEEESKNRKDTLSNHSYEFGEHHLPNHYISPSGSHCDSPRPSNSGAGRALSRRSPHNSEPPTPARDNFIPSTFVDLNPSVDAPTGVPIDPIDLQPASTDYVDEGVESGVDVGLDLFGNGDMDDEGDEYMS